MLIKELILDREVAREREGERKQKTNERGRKQIIYPFNKNLRVERFLDSSFFYCFQIHLTKDDSSQTIESIQIIILTIVHSPTVNHRIEDVRNQIHGTLDIEGALRGHQQEIPCCAEGNRS